MVNGSNFWYHAPSSFFRNTHAILGWFSLLNYNDRMSLRKRKRFEMHLMKIFKIAFTRHRSRRSWRWKWSRVFFLTESYEKSRGSLVKFVYQASQVQNTLLRVEGRFYSMLALLTMHIRMDEKHVDVDISKENLRFRILFYQARFW